MSNSSLIQVDNMIVNFKVVQIHASKADQVPLQTEQKSASMCLCACKFKFVIGTHAGDYGFIPLQPFGRLTNNTCPSHDSDNNYVDLHNKLVNIETPNCAGSQFKIPTDLNIPLWEELLEVDRGHQLIYFLKYGFPLDMPYSPAFEPNTVITNHSTA